MNSINSIHQYNSKKTFKILIAFFILLLVSYMSIFKGIANINLKRVLVTIFRNLSFDNTEALSAREMVVFLDLRLARVILATIAGFLLAICGTVMQAITENKMSSPFTTGISSAASMGAALSILLFTGKFIYFDLITIFFAFSFGVICSLLVYGISNIKGMNKSTLILTGIAFNYLFSSGNAALQFIANEDTLSSIVNWSFGNLSGVSWNKIFILFFILIIFFPYFFINRDSYNLLLTGEDSATSLGIDVKKFRFISGIIVTLITSAVVSFIGIIAFVGIIAPHISRMLIGDDHKYSLILSGIIGAFLVVFSDYIGRNLLSPIIIPIGIVISFVGIPIFIYLIINSKRG
ncbi:FecCD family ABC transporter permease [Fusobacterium periodonticum]|uniref:Iron ABC transporter permease n=1 Tax=Fusobacterium periodonticum D10 TaxID=620833 RepID=K1GIP3_9FUSO|nr:iron ABC transporter permease [Fusobacterium periodonticum]EKA93954.1 hypothetical protein FPOG_01311 [Fusobacterium periodonticum D10]